MKQGAKETSGKEPTVGKISSLLGRLESNPKSIKLILFLEYKLKKKKQPSWFSFFLAVTFYKVTVNTELANREPLLLGGKKGSVRFLQASGHIFVKRYITTVLKVYFCLKTP